MLENDDNRQYWVVRNAEDQYSLWPTTRPVPQGWTAVGSSGTKATCLDLIRREWKDMRPKSLRTAMGD
jgi:MbtH protein